MSESALFRSRAGLAAMMVAGALLVVGLIQSASQPTPTDGPAGSSFATHGEGTAALVDLLEANGYDVVRERRPLAEVPPAPGDTLVLVNGLDLSAEDGVVIAAHVADGGRLVAIGSTYLDFIIGDTPREFTRTREYSRGLLPVEGFDTLSRADSGWVWLDTGSLLPVVGNDDGTLMAIQSVGRGTVVAIVHSSVIANERLANGDNALLALLALGEPTKTVRFIEYIHGFTQPTGLAALPTRWKQALLVLALAGVVWLAARGRRFGPPEATARELPPPRSAYVDSLARTLESSRDPGAAAPLDAALTNALTERGAAPSSTSTKIEAAVAAGADRHTAEQAFRGATDRATVRAKAILLSQLVKKEQL